MSLVADITSWLLIGAGAAFLVTGAVGLLRMPDVYTRMHAASLTDSLGTWLLILGMVIQAGFTLLAVKLLLILAFMFFVSPTATHALAQAAMSSGVRPYPFVDRTDGEHEGAAS